MASGAFERSARLTPDRERRDERLLSAAGTAWSAGLTERALGLLEAHGRERPGDPGRMQELSLRGAIAARTGHVRDAREMLMAAADLATDPNEETVILADAVHANFYLADVSAAVALAQRLAELAPTVTDDRARALGLVATGTARILAGQPGGADDLRAALPLLEATPALYEDPHRLSVVMQVPLYLRDATDGGPTVRDLVEAVRGQAGIGALPAVLWHLARDQAAALGVGGGGGQLHRGRAARRGDGTDHRAGDGAGGALLARVASGTGGTLSSTRRRGSRHARRSPPAHG